MKFYPSGADLAKDMGVPLDVLVDTHQKHYEAAKKTEADPDGGSWPAYPSGKSWDEASGKTGSGKKFYHNIIPGDKVKSEPFYVAIITPVIHYCMGGLEIDVNSACVGAGGKVIPGLYAAGEVAGGVHGNNRLGGNSLLDCVVFGRVAGKHCAEYILGEKGLQSVNLKDLAALPAPVKKGAPAAAGAAAPAKTGDLSAPLLEDHKELHYWGKEKKKGLLGFLPTLDDLAQWDCCALFIMICIGITLFCWVIIVLCGGGSSGFDAPMPSDKLDKSFRGSLF